MASTFDTLFGDYGVPVLQDQCGEAATHTATDGTETVCTVAVGAIRTDEDVDDHHGRILVRRAEATIFYVADGVTPRDDDTLTIDGEVWHVERTLSKSGTAARVQLVSRGSVEHSRPGYRPRR